MAVWFHSLTLNVGRSDDCNVVVVVPRHACYCLPECMERALRHEKESLLAGKASLLKNLVLGYFVAPSNSRAEVLRVVATVLDFSQEERKKIGLDGAEGGGWFKALLHPGKAGQDTPIEFYPQSLSEAFIRFLESESRPHPQLRLLPESKSSSASGEENNSENPLFPPLDKARQQWRVYNTVISGAVFSGDPTLVNHIAKSINKLSLFWDCSFASHRDSRCRDFIHTSHHDSRCRDSSFASHRDSRCRDFIHTSHPPTLSSLPTVTSRDGIHPPLRQSPPTGRSSPKPGRSPLLLADVQLPTFVQFPVGRNSSSFLKDVLKDS
uniref:GRIP domain-containing protein n=1 Tax=Timema shepardi TaxID=629360 RepID=A0A7R9B784_TIMSH|nr:unnamed protein product [Timema shepardi]